MKFSKRTEWDLSENEYARALRLAKKAGKELIDLTTSNPTAAGFVYETDALLASLGTPAAARYDPHPLGAKFAREAVAQYYSEHNALISPEAICLTTSTSEAYSHIFRLLCDVGDEVLVASPSYPLFDFVAQLSDLRLRHYPLFYDGLWHINLPSLEATITPRTKAIIIVHPNNPTGNYVSRQECAALLHVCARRGIALIVDEVFLDYSMKGTFPYTFASTASDALTFILSGVSKVCGLPQMKLSWLVTCGPERLVRSALDRLEVITDTFLSISSPAQYALPHWLATRESLQQQIRARCADNLQTLATVLGDSHADQLSAQGGWTAVLRVPREVDGEPFAIAALKEQVVVQPGEFYGLSAGHVVISLLTPQDELRKGLQALPIF